MLVLIAAWLGLAAWVYLLAFHGGFWRTARHDNLGHDSAPAQWPRIVAVVPARDEAGSIGDCVRSILGQAYPGELSLIVVDDQSSDGTATIAQNAAQAIGAQDRLTIVTGTALPAGWTGKLWAVKQGLTHAEPAPPDFVLLTDADIVYDPDALAVLAARAQSRNLVMASVMAKLRCESTPEITLIPAFIFFFAMLYPFAWVNRRDCRTGAAAGGCMLVQWNALRDSGGIDAIRGALIDDCALGQQLKRVGPVWLGYSDRVRSVRVSERFSDVGRMISRSAYAQLRYSPWLLAGTIAGLALIYLAPPAITLFGSNLARIPAILAWAAMAVAFQPVLRYYDRSPLWGVALPAIACAYLMYTINSAIQYTSGRGGLWKGRVQANVAGPR